MIIYCKKQILPSLQILKDFFSMMQNGETLIIFFTLFDITTLHDNLEKIKFKQLRLCECLIDKQKDTYFITCVKKSKPTFNSRYDNGIYETSLHQLIIQLIKKHSKENEIIKFIF